MCIRDRVQLAGLGYVKSLRDVREYVRNSFELRVYEPRHTSRHEDMYTQFLELLSKLGRI